MALCARPGLTLPHAAPRPASQLILRCINATQSAYLSLTFHARYFETYDVFNQDVVQAGVLMKVREVQPPRARPWSGGLDVPGAAHWGVALLVLLVREPSVPVACLEKVVPLRSIPGAAAPGLAACLELCSSPLPRVVAHSASSSSSFAAIPGGSPDAAHRPAEPGPGI